MSVDFAGAAVGTAFGELCSLVKHVVNTVAAFRPQLKKIDFTLSEMDPIIKDIYHLYEQLDRLKEMDPIKKLLDEGKGLVNNCLRIHSLNWYKRYTHSNKLTEYDVAVREKFQIYMPLLATRNHAEMLIKMDEIMSRWPGQANGGGLQSGLGTWGNLSVPVAPAFMVGSEAEVSMREIKLRLLKGGVSVIVVTAPGGCGKTTLLKKLCYDGEIKGKFNNIMFVRVSRKPNLIGIVQQMYQHNSFEAPEIEAEDGAFSCLEQLLNRIGQDPVLLVLDDVWAEWESILKKFVSNGIKDYKIVVTSRYEFPYFRPVHHLKPLTHNEAVKLFRESVVVDDGSMDAPDDETLDQIVKRCKGLPLALTVVAKSLRGKDRPIWESKLLDWSEGHSPLGSDSEILDCLRKSLDDLDGDPSIKERFMDLGSFVEDCKIPATALIDMWVELYKLDFKGVRAIADLHELVYRNLADLIVTRRDSNDDNKSCSGYYAMQHDMLRELAIMKCNKGEIEKRERLILELIGNNFPDWWSKQKQQPLGARLVSISTEQIGQLTSLEVVRLNSCITLSQLPDSIKSLQNVRLLNISDCQKLSVLPDQIGQMVKLERINIRGCPQWSGLPRSIMNLRNLTKVICENEKASMWKPLKDTLPSLDITLFEEKHDLAWLGLA